MARLNSTKDTKRMGTRVLRAFRKSGIVRKHIRRTDSFYEHGQWWVQHLDTGAQWAAQDCAGYSAVDGFCFEQVTRGDEE